jgi:amino acid adenylation domain-containing protein
MKKYKEAQGIMMKDEIYKKPDSKRTVSKDPGLSPAKLALLEKWLSGEAISELSTIPKRTTHDKIPLSFAQQRLWFIDNLIPESPAYNVPCAVRLTGPLNISVLEQCLNEMVRRHEALRTIFPAVEGEAYQVILPELTVPFEVFDLRDYPGAEREKRALELIDDDEQRLFNLVKGPLLRATLIRIDEEDHIFQFTLHHIVCDGWATAIIVREIADMYEAFSAGKASPLPDLPVQYPDFACWQRQWLQGERLQTQLGYWKKQLADAPILELPSDRPRPAIQNLVGARHSYNLPSSISKRVEDMNRQAGATTFMIVLAAFKTLLFRYTGQEDILVGVPIANRNRPEIENLIGFFANTLVMRTDLSGNPPFLELLERVREITMNAYDNQDLPFEWLVGELQPERDMSRNPLFQVMFTHQNWKQPPQKESSLLSFHALESRKKVALFDLWFGVWNERDFLGSAMEYSTDLFDTATIIRLRNHFITLLDSAVSNPERRLSDLQILTEDERIQLLVEWNDTRVEYPGDSLLHRLCENRAEQIPDAIAAVFEDQHLSYARLNANANQLAHYLQKRGVGSEVVVAICMERSLDLVIALLGILKAGGAYLPIDPKDPPDRVLYVLNDSQAGLLLSRENIIRHFPFASLQNLKDVREDIVVTNTRPQITDLDALPFPDRNLVDYSKYDKYFAQGLVKKVINLVATRGCPYNCYYCHKIWPRKHIARSARDIFEEVKIHYDKGYRTFSFVDDIFNLDRRNSETFFQSVVKNNLKIRLLFPSGVRGDILTPDYIDLMSEAGLVLVALALETASPRLQRLIHKNLDIEKLRENILYICKKHPHIVLELFTMFGFPAETEEEVLMTFEFVKSIKWLHFPYLNALKIFPNTDMARLAMEHGVSKEAIEKFSNLSYNQLGDTLPFSRGFARQYQANFMKQYFLLPERLQSVIPCQKQVLTHEEIIAKYDNYLPGGLRSYPKISRIIEENAPSSENAAARPDKIAQSSLPISISHESEDASSGSPGGLRIILIDVSLLFSHEAEEQVYNPYNPIDVPIGLMYLMTYLKREFGSRVNGKVLKAMVDFDNFDRLKCIIDRFQPQVIGLRGLSIYKDFFHKTAAVIGQWNPDTPVIAGGPYATSEYDKLLADRNISLVVLGEGEITFAHLIGNILDNNGKLPGEEILREIPGLAFVPRQRRALQDPSTTSRDILLSDILKNQVAGENSCNPAAVNHEANLAYLIYTSGSTGEPKGVMNTHRGICNRLLWMQDAYGLTPADVVMQKTPYTFDVSVWEFFWPLLTGARLAVACPDGHKDIAYLVHLIKKEKITTLHFVPSMLRLFLEEGDLNMCGSLKRVICSGEEMTFVLQERFFAVLEAELHNLYGPTEAAVDVTAWACRHDYPRHVVPIGKPIANIQVYLLDQHLNPVPIGVPGELHIGGVGLARGYIGRSDLTEERFIPNPFSEEPGSRLYKTGDLARFLPDGSIEFLGRLDFQVKIRGVRIELGEIESLLMQHPALSDAVVLAAESGQTPGHKQLAAYVIPNPKNWEAFTRVSGEELATEQVRDWQNIFDRTYGELNPTGDPTLNILGWNSSYTGQPLPEKEMREWVEQTVRRIMSLKPGRVLEIGCGTGLLLLRIAPVCTRYWGTDFSAAALDYVRQQLDKPGQELPQVKLLQKTADDFAGLQGETFDTVILNSVVQYFPGVEFLLHVLKSCAELVGEKGSIFIGDVRSLPLLEAFYTTVELERAPLSLSAAELRHRVQRRIAREQELVINPAFFFALRQDIPRLSHVEIQLKRGVYDNELNRFRSDVILHIGQEVQPVKDLPRLDWKEKNLTLAALRQMLQEKKPDILGIVNVPNPRLSSALRSAALLSAPDQPESVDRLHDILRESESVNGAVPEEFWALGEELSYSVDVCWSDPAAGGCFDLVFKKRTASGKLPLPVFPIGSHAADERHPWSYYTNNPLRQKITLQLVPELRRYLKEKMSEYLVPSYFVVMDEWPLTSSGKLNRQALPSPFRPESEEVEEYAAPRTMLEEKLADIWKQVLGLEKVGINDNFFELGGDSIHSIWVVARANKAGIRINPQQIFQNQTVAELAEAAGSVPGSETQPGEPLPVPVRAFSLVESNREVLDRLKSTVPDIEDVYPLGPYQEHILHSTHSNREAAFVFQRLNFLKIPGFDIPVLERALQRMVELRPTLRTSFVWEDVDEPLQIVHRHGKVPVEQQDWRELPPDDQSRQLEIYAEAERERGFPLTTPMAIRFLIARASEDGYHVLMTGSYLRGDGWSLELAFAEAIDLYQAFSAGREDQKKPPPLYRNYIAWVKRQNLAEAETFWQQNLEGFTRPTPLVRQAPGNIPGQAGGLGRQHVYLAESTTASLESLAREHRVTLNTVLQAAWALLLSHYADQEDVLFGVTVSGRTIDLPEVESTAGPLFNTLPRRVQVPKNKSLEPWLKEIMIQQGEINRYEYTSLDKIHEWSEVPENLPLFESYLVFQNLRGTIYSKGNSRDIHQLYAQVDCPLRVDVFPQAEMALVMTYHKRSFNDISVHRMLEHFQGLLESMAANPHQSLESLARAIDRVNKKTSAAEEMMP